GYYRFRLPTEEIHSTTTSLARLSIPARPREQARAVLATGQERSQLAEAPAGPSTNGRVIPSLRPATLSRARKTTVSFRAVGRITSSMLQPFSRLLSISRPAVHLS